MKVSEILQSSMINDNTVIYISKPMPFGDLSFKGHWYEDRIMDFAEDEITKLTYIRKENKVYMEVEG